MRVAVEIPKSDTDALAAGLQAYPKGAARVVYRAINKIGKSTRTYISREVRKKIAIKAKDANKCITYHRGRLSNPTGRIKIRGKRLPLIQFGASQTKKGVTYRIEKGGGRKRMQGGFIATMRSGHRGVFSRRGKSRLPIHEAFGVSIPYAVSEVRQLARTTLERDVSRKLTRELRTQVGVLLDQEARKAARKAAKAGAA